MLTTTYCLLYFVVYNNSTYNCCIFFTFLTVLWFVEGMYLWKCNLSDVFLIFYIIYIIIYIYLDVMYVVFKYSVICNIFVILPLLVFGIFSKLLLVYISNYCRLSKIVCRRFFMFLSELNIAMKYGTDIHGILYISYTPSQITSFNPKHTQKITKLGRFLSLNMILHHCTVSGRQLGEKK